MTKTDVMARVAQTFRTDLNGNAFTSTNPKEIRRRLREFSGSNGVRLTEAAANQIQAKMREQGIDVFPDIAHANGGDLRLYRSGSCAADIARLIMYPSASTDRELANLILKAKGKWEWHKAST